MAQNIFEKVLENVDIVDVVRRYVDLEPKGKNLFGVCPFHDDHSPSMSVSKEKGIFYCFTCHEGGNAIKFIEKYKKLSSIEAATFLAQEYHIDISEFNNVSSQTSTINKYYNAMDTAAKFYSFLMNDENLSKDAREYLKSRGIDDNTINEFKIGLSIEDNHALTKTLMSKGYLKSDLIITSLANENEDLFIDRIMVPIRNESGRVVAFGGRIYKKESMDKDLSKYMNSKESPIFKKGETIFNLDKAIDALKTTNYLIVNEGYMDVITSYSRGVKNAVAIMGTNITDEQVNLLKKYTKNVAICLDGDKAGMDGVKNLIRGFEKANMNYSVTILPNDMDPDEFIRKNGIELYKEYITTRRLDKMGYIYEVTKKDYGAITSFNLESFKNDIFRQMKDETSNTTIETNLRKLSLDLKISYEAIKEDFKQYRRRLNPGYKEIKEVKVDSNKFSVKNAYAKAQELVIQYSITDKSYFSLIEGRMGGRLFLRDKELRKIFITIGDLYDYFGILTASEVNTKLKEKGIDFTYNENYSYSTEDLEEILVTFKKESLKEEIEFIKGTLSQTVLSKEERDSYLLELQQKQRELKKL